MRLVLYQLSPAFSIFAQGNLVAKSTTTKKFSQDAPCSLGLFLPVKEAPQIDYRLARYRLWVTFGGNNN